MFRLRALNLANIFFVQLSKASTLCRYVCQYIARNRYGPNSAMYLSALCQGLDNALEPYRAALVQLEQELLTRPATQLSLLQHLLTPYRPVLRALAELLKTIQKEEHRGCMLLDLVYKVFFVFNLFCDLLEVLRFFTPDSTW